MIADPEQHTTMDASGAVRSIQAADITMPAADMLEIWSPMYLERLARTYWKYLSRVTLGLIRVEYTAAERAVVLLHRPLVLLRFKAPEYEIGQGRGIVRWTIRNGILVARPGRSGDGYLEIDVRRVPADEPGSEKVHVEVEVANFYPALATWVARWFYKHTQSRIHVLVTHGFLRSLARLELEESAVGRFAPPKPEAPPGPHPMAGEPPVNVGDTPWLAWAGIAAGITAASAFLYLRFGTRLRRRR
ncbi:MAG TPA: hypothetical protein VFN44_24950 [Solirubrobacteraceae bacterium]|nr:hypothetical protein [Solirubrobacteraceae bacterium]